MELIIFDCDGTLVDSEFLCNLGLQQQLASEGCDADADQLLEKYRGVSFNLIKKDLAERFNVTFSDAFEAEYRHKVSQLFTEQLKAIEGVDALLKSLTIPFCVASSGPRVKIEQALQVTGLAKYFGERIFSSYDIGSWKPEPDLFLHAAKMMNADPAFCCVVEDSLVGLQAANAAKMKSIYYAPHQLNKNPIADLQVKHMSALMDKFNHVEG